MTYSPVYQQHLNNIHKYYTGTVEDYNFWSANYNFHFGYFKRGLNLLNRDQLLEQLEIEMFRRLGITSMHEGIIADIGCGLGGTMRTGHTLNKKLYFKGINFMAQHVQIGNEITATRGFGKHVQLVQGNYLNLPMGDDSVSGAYMMESFCYCPPGERKRLFREVFRAIKPGAKLVISDGFQNRPEDSLGPFYRRMYGSFCHAWALSELALHHEIIDDLKEEGFNIVSNEDISTGVAWSFAHIPFAVVHYLVKKMITQRSWRLSPQTLLHLKGSVLAIIIGLHRRQFRYGFITVRKPG